MKTLLAGSSGKDRAWALHALFNEAADCVAMHGGCRKLVGVQALDHSAALALH
jgi:hypothetical protein